MKNAFISNAKGWGYCIKYNLYFLTSSLSLWKAIEIMYSVNKEIPQSICYNSTCASAIIIISINYIYNYFYYFFITVWTAVTYRPLPCSTAGATFPSEDSKNLSTFSDTRSIFIDSISICSDSPSFCLEDTRSGQKRKETIIG